MLRQYSESKWDEQGNYQSVSRPSIPAEIMEKLMEGSTDQELKDGNITDASQCDFFIKQT